jgi:hypothetical protein
MLERLEVASPVGSDTGPAQHLVGLGKLADTLPPGIGLVAVLLPVADNPGCGHIIDELVEPLGAGLRSILVTVALTRRLTMTYLACRKSGKANLQADTTGCAGRGNAPVRQRHFFLQVGRMEVSCWTG